MIKCQNVLFSELVILSILATPALDVTILATRIANDNVYVHFSEVILRRFQYYWDNLTSENFIPLVQGTDTFPLIYRA